MVKMNLPNKLTSLRMIMIPFFIFFLLQHDLLPLSTSYLIAAILFGLASLTDFFDGYIARKQHLVTNFGKLMDPLADKLLVISAFICFIPLKIAGVIPVILIISREFLVTSVRMIAVENGIVIAANIWGKLKTVIQMVSISVILLCLSLSHSSSIAFLSPSVIERFGIIVMWINAIVTLVSGVTYIWDNRKLFAS